MPESEFGRVAERRTPSYGIEGVDDVAEFTKSRQTSDVPDLLMCSCGCGRFADTFKTNDGLSKICRDLVWFKSQRVPA